MPNNQLVEKRLADLEAAVAELRNRIATLQSPNWIQAIAGTVADTDAFDEALAYGRKCRRSDLPTEQAKGVE